MAVLHLTRCLLGCLITCQVADAEDIRAGEPVSLTVALEREAEGEVRPVDAPRFPGRKDENWWLVVGDTANNTLLAIKRVTLQVRLVG